MRNEFAKVLTISPSSDSREECRRIAHLLNVGEEKIVHENYKAKDFFEHNMNISYLEEISGQDDTPS